jgi:NAD+-dependent protein deacetylase SIR2
MGNPRLATMHDDISDLSSDLSSVPSSPIVPPGFYPYPTPAPSQDPEVSPNVEEDMAPMRKRRKVEPKPRTTQHLDLTSDASQSRYDRQSSLELLLKTLRKRRKIVVVVGAGISVSAGIPDFRSSHGLFHTLKHKQKLKTSGKRLFDASVYKDDSSTSSFHDMVRDLSSMASKAKPTLFHRLLARLASEGRLLRLYTQNIDGVDTSLPPLATNIPLNHKAPWPQTIQLHGGLEMMMCQKCQHTSEFQPHLFQGAMPPLCPKCREADSLRTRHAGKRSHGIGKLRPRIVLYNEHNPDEEAIGAVVTSDLRTRPDAIIVVGTSMKIPGVKRIVREMCGVVRGRQNGVSVWINRDPVPVAKEFEDCWDLVVKGDSDEVARRVNLKEWDDDGEDFAEEYTLSEVERVEARQGSISVVIPRTPSKVKNTYSNIPGVLTPPTSHEDELSDRGHGTKIEVSISAEAPKMQNPASKGRSILDLLNKENRPKGAGRPKGPLNKKSKSNAGVVEQTTITGKVTKHNKSFTKAGKHEQDADQVPLAVRSNINPIVIFPNLSQHSSSEVSPAPESPKATTAWRRSPDTISPSGRLPSGMKDLLN